MKAHSDEEPDIVGLRDKIIGLGELSIRKSYYPELQQKHAELLKKNEELLAAYEELTATDEELRQQYEEISKKEQELRQSEGRLSGIANNIPGIVYQFYSRPDGDMGMYYVSERSAEILGIENNDVDFFSRFTACVVPAERERFLASIDTAVRNVSSWGWEGRFIRPDGREMYIRGISEPVKMDNELVFSGVLLDISERKKAEAALSDSEERYRQLVEHSPDAVVVHTGGIIVYANPASLGILGTEKPEDVVGQPVLHFVHPDFRHMVTGWNQVLAGEKEPLLLREEKFLRVDGSAVYVEVAGMPITFEGKASVQVAFRDITARRKAEEAIAEAHEVNRAIVENSSVGIITYKATGNCVAANETAGKILGATVDQLKRQNFHRILSWKQSGLYEPAVKALETRQTMSAQVEITTTFGAHRWLEVIFTPFMSGEELHLLTMFNDFSERKLAEDAVVESEKFLNSVFENIPDMIFVKDARDLRFVRFNKAGEDLLGYSREELYGKNDYDLFPKDEADFFTGNDREVLKNQRVVDIPEERIQTRLRGERILHTKKISIPDERGKPCYLMGISEDITDRKRAEEIVRINQERLEKSQPLGHVGSWEFDPVARKIWGSDEGFRIYGMIPPENNDLPLETIEACIPERKRIHQALFDLLERNIPYNLEFAINPADGSPQRVITSIAEVVRDDEGRILKVTGVIQDITERKRMENALQLARNKINLLNAVTIQDVQAAAFSLTAYHELIRGRVTDAKTKAFLEKEMALNQKIIDSLNFAKNYQDMGVKPPRWQNIRQVFLFAISHLDFLHITHNLHMDDLEVFADPLLETVFFNLMENVLLYGEHATEVTIRCQEKSDGLVLFIEDNGVGIPAEEKQMIFDRGHGKNTGLGLFLAREVLSITGMTIKETGEPGRGARFEILVPKEGYRFAAEKASA